ncbi:glycosyltransferase [Acidipropionibacterium jensenii]|uniref:glycosyltransferase n=1 Tax=Acidipropionibacterium jensenii TaxID=1749 RepID=UPI002649848D|nr:glycosyltransferase [Acidipropionibacterium jensenii]MDN5996512.1 glycosyltransferase [Acidipropionibacterium jensenii]MDN6624016.1 glycosyltransferase [Acidipropionibacterium jensenii]
MKVLHITECYDGGVGHALDTRVRATPELEHFLMWSGLDDPADNCDFSEVMQLPDGLLARVRAVRATVKRIQPDVVHAHSSWAGVYARIAPLSVPVVYEPHCFKFDDPDLHPVARLAFRAAERVLARRTRVFGSLSSHEDFLARSLGSHVRTVRIPNVPTVPIAGPGSSFHGSATKAVMIGRIAAQKDPQFFADVAAVIGSAAHPLESVWIGDGTDEGKALLRDAGVRVTGWLSPESIVNELHNAVYVHSARYEGFPLSILDAAAQRIPIVARCIPPLEEIDIAKAVTPSEVAALALALAEPGAAQDRAIKVSTELLDKYNVQGLHDALTRLYEMAR